MKHRRILVSAALAGALAIVRAGLAAQAPPPAQQPSPPQTAQAAALVDLTGYWVSVVNQDWRFRMMTPPKGDYAQVPLNAAGRKIADQFDPAQYGGEKYQVSGIIDCRAYGAANVMHMPTRLRITWDSPNVLKIETDWGEQTRLFHFEPDRLYGDTQQDLLMNEDGRSHGQPSMQGHSVAAWERPYQINAPVWQRGPTGRGGGLGTERLGERQPGGSLAVVTANLIPGWLRRNGVPYSSRTRVIEHYRTFQDPTGKQWFNVTNQVIDPEYLNRPFNTTADFRKEPDGSKWAPHPCKKVA
jgi:hypothetical protein